MTEDLDRLDVLAARQIDAAFRFYADQMPAHAAAAGLDQGEFAAVMVDVKAVRRFKGDHVLAAVRERDELRAALRRAESVQRCIWTGCVATWKHWHGGFPGGYDDPANLEGEPISFVSDDPDPSAVRDYNGAALHREDGAS